MIYLKLIWSYLKIGLFGFGGGYAMLALIENEIVTPGWITEKMFTDIVAISQMTPGPIGINSATYIGYVAPMEYGYDSWIYGVLGSILCTLVVTLPSFILVTYLSHYINRRRESAIVKGVFMGLRPVVVGLIASAALLLMNSANFGATSYDVTCSILICVASFCLVFFTKLHPILVIVLAGIAGFFIF
jgi:chromate transporter